MKSFMFSAPEKDPISDDAQRLEGPARTLKPFALGRAGLAICVAAAVFALETYEHRNAAAMDDRSRAVQTLPSFSNLVERVAPAVVSIRMKARPGTTVAAEDAEGQSADETNPFEGTPLERFFDSPGVHETRPKAGGKGATPLPVQGQGSGFFISPDGYIVTNNHVVENAVKIDAVTADGEIYAARVIGADPGTDLALLKIDSDEVFPYVPLGRSNVKVGDWVIALGNPFGLEGTVTAGIVSARGRDIGMGAYDDFIQIDAPVNRGNSGGPTFNQAGEVIGVNTAIFSPTGGSVGIAFAIPVKTVETIVAQLKEKGRVTRGWLGVQVQAVTPELAEGLGLKQARGALISLAEPGSPADTAGLTRGDVIVKINEAEIRDSRDMARKVAATAPGTTAEITIVRGGVRQVVKAKLGELAEETKLKATPVSLKPQSEIASLGISVTPSEKLPNGETGLTVLDIKPDGRAADAGLVAGDILIAANGAQLSSVSDIEKALSAARRAGKKYALAFVRRGSTEVFVALSTEGL